MLSQLERARITFFPFYFYFGSAFRTKARNEYLDRDLAGIIGWQVVRSSHVYCSSGSAYEPNTVTVPEPTNAETKTHRLVRPPSAAGNAPIVG